MNQLMKLFAANLKMTFREKQVWFWSIFYPVLLMVIFLTIFGGTSSGEPSFSAKVALVDNESQMPMIREILMDMEALEWKDEQPVSREQAEDWVKNKDIDAAIILPEGDSSTIQLIFNTEKQNSTTVAALTGMVENVSQSIANQGNPPTYAVEQNYITSAEKELTYNDFLMTGLIALAISQAGLFGHIGMVEMRRNGMLKRLRMTPINMRLFGFSNMLVRFVLSLIQIFLLTMIGVFLYGVQLNFNVLSFLIMFIVGTMSFSAMGYFFAAISKSQESYFGMANLVSFLMMFLSGVFFDYNMMPNWLKPVADFMPLTYFVNGIRDGMIYGIDIASASFLINTGVLLAWMAVLFVVSARLFKSNPGVR